MAVATLGVGLRVSQFGLSLLGLGFRLYGFWAQDKHQNSARPSFSLLASLEVSDRQHFLSEGLRV